MNPPHASVYDLCRASSPIGEYVFIKSFRFRLLITPRTSFRLLTVSRTTQFMLASTCSLLSRQALPMSSFPPLGFVKNVTPSLDLAVRFTPPRGFMQCCFLCAYSWVCSAMCKNSVPIGECVLIKRSRCSESWTYYELFKRTLTCI